jgi:hypothetical protein
MFLFKSLYSLQAWYRSFCFPQLVLGLLRWMWSLCLVLCRWLALGRSKS